MKKIILFIMGVLSLGSAIAQGAKTNEAEKLMEKVSKRYKAFKSIKADFVFTIANKQENSQEKQKGTILVKGNKFRLDIANQLIICNNKTIWTYSREVNEVQINHYSPKEAGFRLDDIFTMYGKGFLYKILEVKKEGGRDLTYVELTPKDKKKKFFKIKVALDRANQTITSSQVFYKDGSIHTYSVTNQYPNLKFDDNQFEFDVKKYAGVEIVDLR